jgi:hypothetical protein
MLEFMLGGYPPQVWRVLYKKGLVSLQPRNKPQINRKSLLIYLKFYMDEEAGTVVGRATIVST